jgi:hypothetical protein
MATIGPVRYCRRYRLKDFIAGNHDSDDLRAAASEAGACEYVVKENLLELRGSFWIKNPEISRSPKKGIQK